MSIMTGKEMMAVCEEKGLLVPHDDIPIIGLDGTVVKNTTVTYPTVFAIIVGRLEFFPMSGGRGGCRTHRLGNRRPQRCPDGRRRPKPPPLPAPDPRWPRSGLSTRAIFPGDPVPRRS